MMTIITKTIGRLIYARQDLMTFSSSTSSPMNYYSRFTDGDDGFWCVSYLSLCHEFLRKLNGFKRQ